MSFIASPDAPLPALRAPPPRFARGGKSRRQLASHMSYQLAAR